MWATAALCFCSLVFFFLFKHIEEKSQLHKKENRNSQQQVWSLTKGSPQSVLPPPPSTATTATCFRFVSFRFVWGKRGGGPNNSNSTERNLLFSSPLLTASTPTHPHNRRCYVMSTHPDTSRFLSFFFFFFFLTPHTHKKKKEEEGAKYPRCLWRFPFVKFLENSWKTRKYYWIYTWNAYTYTHTHTHT